MAKDKRKDKADKAAATAAAASAAATPRDRGSGATSPVESSNVGDLLTGTCALCGEREFFNHGC